MHVHFSQDPQAVANVNAVRVGFPPGGGHVWSSCGCSTTPQAERVYG
jgi:hypothetical protein